jgi:hypothetical protein
LDFAGLLAMMEKLPPDAKAKILEALGGKS